ncbi:MAG: fructose-bisphosphate aldolase class I [Oceanospirillaceae bacterium]
MNNYSDQLEKIKSADGFIAALDQSGGSTPKALKLYGVEEDAWDNDEGMYQVVHQMRTRIMTSASFTGERVIGAILFENTMDRQVDGKSSADFLWENKKVVPFLKVDKGLLDEASGVQLMKAMPDLDVLLVKAKANGIFGTKMRSVIKLADQAGIEAVVEQQFAVAKQILAAGLMPIIEPEVDIHCAEKPAAEEMLNKALLNALNDLNADQQVMLKLTLPETTNLYAACIAHSQVVRVVALSGGYNREEANKRLSSNSGMIASFSRALSEGLFAGQTQSEFDSTMDKSIEAIFQASKS